MKADRNVPKEPFFLVGAVRSGTTLVRLLLGHHSKICRCEEMEFVATPMKMWGGRPPLEEYHHYLALDRGFRSSGYRYNPALSFDEQARDFLSQRLRSDARAIVGATVHHHFEWLPEIWPSAKYIYLRRDPRDVARSCVQMGWAGTAWAGASVWEAAEDQWKELTKRVPREHRIEIRFEDVIADTKGTLEKVCEFLGVKYEDKMLEIDKDTTYSPPDAKAPRSWRDSASEWEIRQVEARIGIASLELAGYQHSTLPPLSLNPRWRARLAAEDVFVRVQSRIKQFGFGLWLQGVLSRRLPLRSWKESVQLKIDHIVNQNLQ